MRDVRLGQIDAFIPMIDAIMFLVDLIIATLLYVQAAVFRSRALTVLASGYVFTALLLVPHALTFPGAFAPDGLLGAGINTTAWIDIFWRAAFPIAIILYVLLKRADAFGAARHGTAGGEDRRGGCLQPLPWRQRSRCWRRSDTTCSRRSFSIVPTRITPI